MVVLSVLALVGKAVENVAMVGILQKRGILIWTTQKCLAKSK